MISEEYEYKSASQQGHSAAMHYVRNFGKKSKTDVLDKIKEEIKALSNANPSYWHSGDMVEREEVFDIIDKYKAESEG